MWRIVAVCAMVALLGTASAETTEQRLDRLTRERETEERANLVRGGLLVVMPPLVLLCVWWFSRQAKRAR
jgi:hypothetical protein